MPTIEFDPSEGVSTEQQASEANALAQGEKIAEMNDADQTAKLEALNEESSNEAALIGGKFKSQDDLLKAYEELQKKLGKPKEDEESSDSNSEEGLQEEEGLEEVEAQPSEEVANIGDDAAYIMSLSTEYESNGKLSEESLSKLAAMDQRDLIAAYFEYQESVNASNAAKQMAATEVSKIQESVGGAKAYTEMVTWAAENLSPQEISDFNTITTGDNVGAARFAVEALSNRWKAAEGYEAPLITGKTAAPGIKPFRSQAELARAMRDPRYREDPAYRMDVEERLSNSQDLL